MVLIKLYGILIDRMSNNPAGTRDLGCRKTAPQRVGQQMGSQTHSLEAAVDRKTRQEQERNPVGHPPP